MLTQGTRPSKKTKNIKDLRRYLNVASVNQNGLLVVRKSDPFLHQTELIIVPSEILPDLLTTLYLQFLHPSKHQLSKVFNRYSYALNVDAVISNVLGQCAHCNSLKRLTREMFDQSSSPSTGPGQQFAADGICRQRQKVFSVRDVFRHLHLPQLLTMSVQIL